MSIHDDHVQHTWNLTSDDGDRFTIELWTDGYSVRVHGSPDDGHDDDRGREAIEEQLLPKYAAAGYRIASSYAVNDPASLDDEEPTGEPDGKPEACPECGDPVEYIANHCADFREGEAWLCTGCRWGQWITA
ncbi:hypothetical protein [Streptomyces swartbergensis]|uniref:Uncharacterized protein n=1 Tax=Streptomyces swartbergensis TaxID=487165 RepID=A0A243S726_9ACTN|nr:hypothetical protein [Streptomyces swartbergensis]OUD03339.1 hypothetical protein CA983_10035 [Streptomyces swartbergensis]